VSGNAAESHVNSGGARNDRFQLFAQAYALGIPSAVIDAGSLLNVDANREVLAIQPGAERAKLVAPTSLSRRVFCSLRVHSSLKSLFVPCQPVARIDTCRGSWITDHNP